MTSWCSASKVIDTDSITVETGDLGATLGLQHYHLSVCAADAIMLDLQGHQSDAWYWRGPCRNEPDPGGHGPCEGRSAPQAFACAGSATPCLELAVNWHPLTFLAACVSS